MPNKEQMKALAREALKLVEGRAPAIVDERILAETFDLVAEYTGELMGKLANIDAEDEKAIVMAHGIIRDGLLREIIKQINKNMLAEADKRISTLLEKK